MNADRKLNSFALIVVHPRLELLFPSLCLPASVVKTSLELPHERGFVV